jgi:molecular chaperone IbpA
MGFCWIAQDEDLTMRLDLTPYRRSTVGFDRLFDMIETNARAASSDNYPPFNLERIAQDRYRITLAVAGFARDEIAITAQQNLLLVSGKKDEKAPEGQLLHVGIANRSFERRFELADFVLVHDARLADGLLVIDLVREVAEAMKPKSIAIKIGAPLAAVDASADTAVIDQAA